MEFVNWGDKTNSVMSDGPILPAQAWRGVVLMRRQPTIYVCVLAVFNMSAFLGSILA